MEVLFNDPENMDIKMTSTIVDNKSQGMRDNAQNWGDIRHIESIKEQANTQFKSEEYVKAIEAYTKALGFSSAPVETRHTLLSNQAQCYMLLHEWDTAFNDTTLAMCSQHLSP